MDMFKKVKEKEFSPVSLKKVNKIVYTQSHQIGKTNSFRDKKRKALPPGKRISKKGKVYYEYRKNRTDLTGTKI